MAQVGISWNLFLLWAFLCWLLGCICFLEMLCLGLQVRNQHFKAPSSSEAGGLSSMLNISINPYINASTVLLEDSLCPKVALSGAMQHPSGSRQEIRKRKLSFQLSGLHVNSPPEIDMHANMARSNLEETLQVRSMPGGNSSKINGCDKD